jgi:hypothetical protein
MPTDWPPNRLADLCATCGNQFPTGQECNACLARTHAPVHHDPELNAISVIARELNGLGDPDAVARVIRYLADRYGSDED